MTYVHNMFHICPNTMHIFSFGDRRELTVRIYEMMRRSKWGSTLEANEFVVKVLGKGFRSLGEQSLVV